MRNYLFRAQEIKTNKWVYGFYLEIYNDNKERQSIIQENTIQGLQHTVSRETLCQYIEETDRKGVPIYEHDIVKVYGYNLNNGKVIFHNHEFKIEYVSQSGSVGYCAFHAFPENSCEVVGNIFEKRDETDDNTK